ncbi:hypothetical protein [Cupriavidus necator]
MDRPDEAEFAPVTDLTDAMLNFICEIQRGESLENRPLNQGDTRFGCHWSISCAKKIGLARLWLCLQICRRLAIALR